MLLLFIQCQPHYICSSVVINERVSAYLLLRYPFTCVMYDAGSEKSLVT